MLIRGINRYRNWIDSFDLGPLVASWLLSGLVMGSLTVVAQTVLAHVTVWAGAPPLWAIVLAVAAVPLEVYLGIAQMTQWSSAKG